MGDHEIREVVTVDSMVDAMANFREAVLHTWEEIKQVMQNVAEVLHRSKESANYIDQRRKHPLIRDTSLPSQVMIRTPRVAHGGRPR